MFCIQEAYRHNEGRLQKLIQQRRFVIDRVVKVLVLTTTDFINKRAQFYHAE